MEKKNIQMIRLNEPRNSNNKTNKKKELEAEEEEEDGRIKAQDI
jgi:hypothetical protein